MWPVRRRMTMTANLPAAALADRGAMINELVYQTVLVGEIRDQSHLYSVLDRVRSLGLELVSVQPSPTDQADDQGTRASKRARVR